MASGRGRAKISDFLTKLAENKTFAREYEEEPSETMEGFGLSPSQRALIRSGDLRRIREAIERPVPIRRREPADACRDCRIRGLAGRRLPS